MNKIQANCSLPCGGNSHPKLQYSVRGAITEVCTSLLAMAGGVVGRLNRNCNILVGSCGINRSSPDCCSVPNSSSHSKLSCTVPRLFPLQVTKLGL